MFTIEDLIEKINEPKSKELFRDVYATYAQGQYRATVVMLWTVVVCDLIYKLQYLRDVYNDSTAISILNEIENKQKKNPKNPEWENYLLQVVKDRTQFIDNIEKEALENLQKQRNICAHPIITNNNILFQPSQELTRALMRTALDSILLKTPLLAKEYIKTILEDFEKRKNDFGPWDDTFERYFQNRYLQHLTVEQILKLYKLLWRLVFSPHNDKEKLNITINARMLEYILNNYNTNCIDFMKKSIDTYTFDNSCLDSVNIFRAFMIRHSSIYRILSEQTKALFEATNKTFINKLQFYRVTENDFNQCIDKIKECFKNRSEIISDPNIYSFSLSLKEKAKEYNALQVYYNLCIEWYAGSSSFDEANLLFDSLIKFNYMDFDKNNILKLIDSSAKNSQTYYRHRANDDHKLLMKHFLNLEGTYEELNDYGYWQNLFIEIGGTPF